MTARHWFAIAVGILMMTAAFYVFFKYGPTDEFVQISAIVLFGFGLTVAMFAVLVNVFAHLGMGNSGMALGLPDGSIRALLAFSLVIIFASLATFLYSRIDKDDCQTCSKVMGRVSDAQLNDLKANFIVAAEQARDSGTGKPLYEQIPGPNGQGTQDDLKHPLYSVTYYPKPNANAADFAKQIFTTLATIFVSVVSFYFGSSVTTSAVKAAQGPGGDKTSPLQTALTNALADSHNAQAVVDEKTAALQKAKDDLNQFPAAAADPTRQAAVQKAQSELDAATADLQKKQAAVQQAQKALHDAQAKTGASSGSSAAGATP